MTLPALLLPPDQANYATTIGETVIATKLDGGASRFRADQLNVASQVAVQWDCNQKNYDYLMAFWRTSIANGSLPFTMDLILDYGKLETYTCRILPGTFGLTSTKGQQYIVGATLEVLSLDAVPGDESSDSTIIAAGPDM